METLVQPGTAPFWVALLTVIGIGVVELVSMLLGASVSALLDDSFGFHDLGHHASGDHESSLLGAWSSWLNAGGVPLLVLIVILLSAFAAFGFAIQSVALGLAGPLPALISVPGALAAAVPTTRWISRGIARIIPRDETSVLSQDEFIGLVGTVTIGPLDQGNPGSVRVKDRYDNFHALRAKAAPGHVIETGALVLIVDGADGLFQAIPAPQALDSDSNRS
ncbi:DUF1449 family protein [Labrys sp. LIt4]|uniref:DUF1449 domain-containing protein n=2 Tax=Xanthobacteraceae TaxID=335928 RepID=A0A2S9QFY6_9HYPH|nr:DUF1449 family protein [Labrys sp. LIt4]PRH88267.1 hypothetical protein C5L14_07085 [Labrys okinawensis]